MTIDQVLLVLPVLLVLGGIVCAATVCIVAICRAHRNDTVAVLKATPRADVHLSPLPPRAPAMTTARTAATSVPQPRYRRGRSTRSSSAR